MHKKGFTLLEILLVIAAIGILAAIVIVAINPQRQLAQVRDTERSSSVNTLYQAMEQYLISEGSYPDSVTTTYQEVCNTGSEPSSDPVTDCTGYLDLRVLVPTYLAAIPNDAASDDPGTGYEVAINSENSGIAIQSINPELAESISVNTPNRTYLSNIYANAEAVYATFQVSPDQEFALRVSNASQQETDIGFDQDGWIDRDALLDVAQGGTLTIRTWYDGSGNNNHANQSTKARQPVIVSSGVVQEDSQGHVAPYFDGSNHFMQSGVASNAVNRPFGVVSLTNPSGISGNDQGRYRVWTRSNSSSTRGAVSYNANNIRMHRDAGNSVVSTAVSANQKHLASALYLSSSVWEFYLNQTLVGSGTVTISSANTTPIHIGAQNSTPDRVYNGHIHFILITNEALEGNRTPIEEYISDTFEM